MISNTQKQILKWLFVIVIVGAIIYTFRDSAGPILEELVKTSPWVVLGICAAALLYEVVESVITFLLARQYQPAFHFRKAVGNTFYCSFYRVATLGSGAGVAAIFYLNENGIEPSKGFGMYMLEYALHKISIAIFSAIFFLLNWSFMQQHFREYDWLLIAGFIITIVITLFLVLFCISEKFHRFLLKLLQLINRKGRFDTLHDRLAEQCAMLENAAKLLLGNRLLVLGTIALNLVKVACWYGIPFLVFYADGTVNLSQVMAITALSVMLAAVIPSPAGIGSTEFVFTALFGAIVGTGLAGSASLLYRFGTFVFPFLVGAVIVIARRVRAHRKTVGFV